MNKIWWKKIHNILGIASALFLVILLSTGILLNHPSAIKKNEIFAASLDPVNPEIMFQATKDGLIISVDSGSTWQEANMLYPPKEVVDIAFAPDRPEVIYLLEKWGKIIVSENGGKIWDSISLPFDPQESGIVLKSLSVGKNQKLLVMTSHGTLTSENHGQDWNEAGLDKSSPPLYRLILTLHNGYFFGPAFVWVYDFSAIALLILIISGLILWKIGRNVA